MIEYYVGFALQDTKYVFAVYCLINAQPIICKYSVSTLLCFQVSLYCSY